jgi:hypothetical protein
MRKPTRLHETFELSDCYELKNRRVTRLTIRFHGMVILTPASHRDASLNHNIRVSVRMASVATTV